MTSRTPTPPKPTADLERLLTVREVAALEAVSTKTITRRIASGALPALHTGRLLRIRPQDLRAYRLKQLLGE
jgi:excisionase family DNA binding protein